MKGNIRRTVYASLVFAAAHSMPAIAAGTPDPGDYLPAPAGTTVMVGYYQNISADRIYEDGKKVGDDLGLRMNVGVARLMHFFELGGKTMDVEVILPYGNQRVRSMDYKATALGNVQIGSTYYPYEDAERGRYWAIAGFVTLPTGQKKKEGFALSEDRYAFDVETAFLTRLSEKWSIDLIGQAEVYTHDDLTRIHRRPMVRGFAHLNYNFTGASVLSASLRQAYGARETLDGQTVLGGKNDTSLQLTFSHQVTDAVQLQVQLVQDVDVRNGSPARTFQFRTSAAF